MNKPIYKKRSSGQGQSSYRSTTAKSLDIHDRYDKGRLKRYNTVLSPIYENVAYLNLEHGFSEDEHDDQQCQDCKEKDSPLPFQAYVEKRQNKTARRPHSEHFPKRRHFCSYHCGKGHLKSNNETKEHQFNDYVERHSNKHGESHSNSSSPYCTKRNYSDVIRTDTRKTHTHTAENLPQTEKIELKHFDPERTSKDQTDDTSKISEKLDLLDEERTSFNKRTLKHTTSNPSWKRTELNANARDYVGYSVIQKFLEDSNFVSDMDIANSRKVRSNSEPAAGACISEHLKTQSRFIDAFDNKTKSMESLNINDTEKDPIKVLDKGSTGTSKQPIQDNPIEAYEEDTCESKLKAEKASNVHQDGQMATTSKGPLQSSLYQGHVLDPGLLIVPSSPVRCQAQPFELKHPNSRRVKLTPLEQRRRRPCCPAERKIEKRCFLIFFIMLVLAVVAFIIFNMLGWFEGAFKDRVANLFQGKDIKPTGGRPPNTTETNSTML